jgi:TRAP-type transport system small permease protein
VPTETVPDPSQGTGSPPAEPAGTVPVAVRRLLVGLFAVNSVAAVVLFAGLTLIVALQVISRFALHVPIIWSEELARFLFFWVVLLGASMSVKTRRHFVIDVGAERLAATHPAVRFLRDAVPYLCIIAFSVLLLVEGIGYTRVGLLRVATNSQVNMALVYAAIPVFAGLTILYSVGHLILGWYTFRHDLRRAGRNPPSRV